MHGHGDLPSLLTAGVVRLWRDHKAVVVAVAVVGVGLHVKMYFDNRRRRSEWDNVGEDVVVVHAFHRAKTAPNMSPFVMKLETYLRMADIKYEFDDTCCFGAKGKAPWITLNGEDYTDSEQIIEILAQKFNKNFSLRLTNEQKAVAKSMQIMTDEHIFWGLAWWRLIKDDQVRGLMKFPCMGFHILRRRYKGFLWAQGLGRHSDAQIEEIIRKDIESLSRYLGKKTFLMGDEPTEVDCCVFGMMAQFVWGTPGSPFAAMLQGEYRNLQTYCLRMKERFWQDWDRLLVN